MLKNLVAEIQAVRSTAMTVREVDDDAEEQSRSAKGKASNSTYRQPEEGWRTLSNHELELYHWLRLDVQGNHSSTRR
jgi:hypothetical protein